ncbi:transcription elongation factor GreA [Geminicoccaceae bacterium 1502E]|nr:transcription elongation factor GreA [Geminicoccaceae bacterium 1502E]
MSRAFVRESDTETGAVPLLDRPISEHPNLVTARGMALIARKVAEHRAALEAAHEAEDAEGEARASRELRYWSARQASAEIVEPDKDGKRVTFGAAVTLGHADGTESRFRIVGEDEAEPAQGRIAWPAPVARALVGSELGDLVQLPTGEVEVLAIDPTPEEVPDEQE